MLPDLLESHCEILALAVLTVDSKHRFSLVNTLHSIQYVVQELQTPLALGDVPNCVVRGEHQTRVSPEIRFARRRLDQDRVWRLQRLIVLLVEGLAVVVGEHQVHRVQCAAVRMISGRARCVSLQRRSLHEALRRIVRGHVLV